MPPNVNFHHQTKIRLKTLLANSDVDCLIAESETGFCQLGQELTLISEDLGYESANCRELTNGRYDPLASSIRHVADWCRKSPEVTLAVVPSRNPSSRMKGLIISPYDGSACYTGFANAMWSRPHRDFFYSVNWQALYEAVHTLSSRHPALMHMSRLKTWKGEFKQDITFCQVEAALNFHGAYATFDNLTFWDPEPGNHLTAALEYFSEGKHRGCHREFRQVREQRNGVHFVTIAWN